MELITFVDLLDVQGLDLQIDRLLERRKSLPELEQYRSNHEKLKVLGAELEKAAEELKSVELQFDKSEGELEMLEAKLTEHETRLFAGGMSSRETEHMRLEVQGLKGQRSAKEERVLVLLEDVDPARALVTKLEAEIADLEGQNRVLETAIKDQWKTIDAELARKEDRKKDAVSPIPVDLMETYEKLRRTKEGVAIGRLDNGVCGGCHMTLSAAEQAEALADDPPRCVHCRRLLVG